MRYILIVIMVLLTSCAYNPVIDTAGQSGTVLCPYDRNVSSLKIDRIQTYLGNLEPDPKNNNNVSIINSVIYY